MTLFDGSSVSSEMVSSASFLEGLSVSILSASLPPSFFEDVVERVERARPAAGAFALPRAAAFPFEAVGRLARDRFEVLLAFDATDSDSLSWSGWSGIETCSASSAIVPIFRANSRDFSMTDDW